MCSGTIPVTQAGFSNGDSVNGICRRSGNKNNRSQRQLQLNAAAADVGAADANRALRQRQGQRSTYSSCCYRSNFINRALQHRQVGGWGLRIVDILRLQKEVAGAGWCAAAVITDVNKVELSTVTLGGRRVQGVCSGHIS